MERLSLLIRRLAASTVFLILGASPLRAVDLNVDGIGWFADGRVANVIREVIFGDEEEGVVLRQFDVEDALLVLNGDLRRRGYLNAAIEVVLWAEDSVSLRYVWDPQAPQVLPDLNAVSRLDLNVTTGPRSFYEAVTFDGLESLSAEEAQDYFFPGGYFVVSRADRAFSPEALGRGVESLLARLAELGRPEARLVAQNVDRPARGGAVRVHLTVAEGPVYEWREVRYEWASGTSAVDGVSLPPSTVPETVYTREGERDLAVALRNRFLRAGFPDVAVESVRRVFTESDGRRSVELVFRANPGPRVRVAGVRFEGLEDTSRSFVRQRVDIEPGAWLSRVEVDEARTRLGRLGIFDQMAVTLEPPDAPDSRTVVFSVVEGLRREINLLAGYGSYEMVRVGAELRYFNLFGRAHQGTLRLRQSMRSSAGLLSYSVPDLPWILQRGQVRLQGLIREEVSFRREEAAFSFGIEQQLFDHEVVFTAEYTYEILRAIGVVSEEETGDASANVGSVTFGLSYDQRDRVISPREGYDLRAELELASPFLASEAYYQRFVLGGSYHFMTRSEAIRFHFGLEHGVLGRAGTHAEDLPFNKRFFPGGENSIRGYQSGEASPRDSQGEIVGAETYTIGHAEVEFAITQNLSVVLFGDGLLTARYLSDYPGDTTLWSVGGGLRYSTPLGPVRLEYGHNLNPRPEDPSGTLHFSIGFPF